MSVVLCNVVEIVLVAVVVVVVVVGVVVVAVVVVVGVAGVVVVEVVEVEAEVEVEERSGTCSCSCSCSCLSIYLSIYLPIYLSIYLAATLKTQLFGETSSIFELDNVKNETILQDFLNFWTWQHQKWNNSARLPQFSKLTTSKTIQFCETSFKNGKLSAELNGADGFVPMRFAIFPLHLSKVLRLPRKSDARAYEVLHLSRKIISENLKIWCSKMQPLSRNQRPDLLTALMNMSLLPPRKMHLCRPSSNAPRLPSFLEMLQNPRVLLTFDKVHNPLRLPRETTSER